MAKKTPTKKPTAGDRLSDLEARIARLEVWASTVFNPDAPPASLALEPKKET